MIHLSALHVRPTRRRIAQAFVTAVLSLSVAVSGAFAQVVGRQVVDTGTRNTRLGRPMNTPRSAGQMSGRQGMSGMHDTSGVSSGKDISGVKDMSGRKGMSGMPAIASGPDSSIHPMLELQARMMAMMELHLRMMADPDIRRRVMGDVVLRSLADRASAPLANGRTAPMEMQMSDSIHASGAGITDMVHGSNRSAKSQRAMTSVAAEKKPAARTPAKPAAPVKPPAEKKAQPMPPMSGMEHSTMPGMGKP